MKTHILKLFYATFLISFISYYSAVAEDTNDVYLLHYKSNGWKTEVRVNGVPILRRDIGGGQLPIGNLILTGSNSVEIKASQLDANPDDLLISVAKISTSPDNEENLINLSIASQTPGYTVKKSSAFNARAPIHWAWETASDLRSLTAADEAEIYQQITNLANAMKFKSMSEHNKIRSLFIRETAEANGIKEDEIKDSIADSLKPFFSNASFNVSVRKSEDLDFEPCGRITSVAPKDPWPDDWMILLKLDSHNYSFGDMLFSKIHGHWELIN